jgi:hypothetical protein
MPDTVMLEPPCPSCGDTLERTTLLWPDPDAGLEAAADIGREILIERPGLWCPACGCAAPDAPEVIDRATRRAA